MKDVTHQDFATPEKQEARAFLRERFLRAINGIIDKECKINLYDNTSVIAKFEGTDLNVVRLYVNNLITPIHTVPHALIRATDVLSIEVPKASYQKLLDP